ncbi:MAG: hypothetical protein JWQ41_913, partial [Variovorax sp.]|nr:hypothetical protein [Variovorax sp.]
MSGGRVENANAETPAAGSLNALESLFGLSRLR